MKTARCINALGVRKSPEDPSCKLGRSVPSDYIDLDRLASSIAPSVHGHLEVKKGLLLMLLGAVAKKSASGDWQSRGSIHVCLLGDPATAKTTLLKWVTSFLDQAVYTSGCSASIAGLTAAVVNDGSKTVMPGALVQASGSVCCIDDFERLDNKGKHAVGEVMDHQSVSISKAGIHTKLHADTSILAACLPKGNCYNTQHPLRSNVDMPESVLQCFDLMHVLRDTCDSNDEVTAYHIVASASGTAAETPAVMSVPDLRRYICLAQTLQPQISDDASARLRNCYGRLREMGKTSPRQLESLIRLSEAVARGHLEEVVSAAHVDEAFTLMGTVSQCTLSRLTNDAKRARMGS